MSQSLGSDNHSGIHADILKAIQAANFGHSPSYGTDDLSSQCRQQFKILFGADCEAFFVFNGTAANTLCLKSLLQSYEAVLCHKGSHMNLDECGAPEFIAGVKLIALDSPDGKLTPELCEQALVRRGDQHHSQIKLLSITQPTEVGTLYTLDELRALSEFCKKNSLYFHIDGARFIHAPQQLACSFKELTSEIGVDAVSFGGTKNGLLFGEAVLLFNKEHHKNFRYVRKQCLQLPSKMRFLAAQFLRLFDGDLWKSISRHECEMARYLAQNLEGIPQVEIAYKVQANSVFAKLPKEWLKPLREVSFFYVWDEKEWVVRWMMSFDTNKDDIDKFVAKLRELSSTQSPRS